MRLTTWSSRRLPTGTLRLSAVAALLVIVAGCGSPGTTPGDQNPESKPSQDQASQPQQTPGSADQATPSAGTSADPAKDLGDPVGSRDGTAGADPATLEMYAVTRADRLITINFSMTLDASAAAKFQVADFFQDDNYDASDGEGHSVDGVQVLDTKNAKLHQVASDGAEHCVCSRGLASAFVEPGQTMFFTAAYGAPPEDVTKVDVQVPHFGTFSNVPVQ